MICDKCKKDFPECEIHESHDVPIYIFDGDRKQRMIKSAIDFAKRWFDESRTTKL